MASSQAKLLQLAQALQYADALLKLKPNGETLWGVYVVQMNALRSLKENRKFKQVFSAAKTAFPAQAEVVRAYQSLSPQKVAPEVNPEAEEAVLASEVSHHIRQKRIPTCTQ